MKTIKYRDFNLGIYKGTYQYGGRIYLSLVDIDTNEEYGDLTINIPDIMLIDEDIILSGDLSNELVDKLEELGIITIYNVVQYNMGRYNIAYLSNDILKDYLIESY